MSLNVYRVSFLGGQGGSPVKRKLISFFIDTELCAQSLSHSISKLSLLMFSLLGTCTSRIRDYVRLRDLVWTVATDKSSRIRMCIGQTKSLSTTRPSTLSEMINSTRLSCDQLLLVMFDIIAKFNG